MFVNWMVGSGSSSWEEIDRSGDAIGLCLYSVRKKELLLRNLLGLKLGDFALGVLVEGAACTV